MKSAAAACLLLFCVTLSFSQPPDTLWTRLYDDNLWDEIRDIAPAADGGFFLAGWSAYGLWADSGDVLVIKTDAMGEPQWRFNPYSELGSAVEAVLPLPDGGCLLAGCTNYSYDLMSQDLYVARLDSQGHALWERVLWPGNTTATGIVPIESGGYAMSGQWMGQAALFVMNDTCGEGWSMSYPHLMASSFMSIEKTADGGYITSGCEVNTQGDYDGLIVKIASNGHIEWESGYHNEDRGYLWEIHQTSDNGYIAVGNGYGFRTGTIHALRLNAAGETLWAREYQPASVDEAWCVCETADHGFIIGGCTQDWNIPDHFATLFLHIDAQGDTIDGLRIYAEQPTEINRLIALDDGGFIAGGYYPITRDTMETDAHLIRLDFGNDVPNTHATSPVDFTLRSYPNPFNPVTTVSFSIPKLAHTRLAVYDLLGREVAVLTDHVIEAGEHRMLFDGAAFPSGLYFARLQSGEFVATQKLMLLK